MDLNDDVQDQNLVTDQAAQAAVDDVSNPTVATPATEAPEAAPLTADEMAAEAEVEVETPSPAAAASTPVAPPATVNQSQPATSGTTESDDQLMQIKQQALEQLSPLVDHLDLPADQKFDTYMEILRASDNKDLVQPAFEVAQTIEDEDKKAQALLDVVNEVNYLTQDHQA